MISPLGCRALLAEENGRRFTKQNRLIFRLCLYARETHDRPLSFPPSGLLPPSVNVSKKRRKWCPAGGTEPGKNQSSSLSLLNYSLCFPARLQMGFRGEKGSLQTVFSLFLESFPAPPAESFKVCIFNGAHFAQNDKKRVYCTNLPRILMVQFTVTVVAFPPKKGPLKDFFQLINGILPITVLLQNQKLPSISRSQTWIRRKSRQTRRTTRLAPSPRPDTTIDFP